MRVGSCQAPEFPPPSIVDYRPKSSLVVAEHPVPRAKFPVVDIHSHTGPTAGDDRVAHRADGRAEHPRAEQPERRIRRRARSSASTYIRSTPLCESFHGVCERDEPVPRRRARLRQAGRGATRSGREERRHRPQDFQRDRHGHDEGGRQPAEDQRSGARADLGDGGAAEHPGHHSYGRAAGVLQAARHAQRALARARAVRQPAAIPRARLIRDARHGTR